MGFEHNRLLSWSIILNRQTIEALACNKAFSRLLVSLADLNEADRISYQRGLIVALPNGIGNSVLVAPFGNPDHFFCGRRDQAWECKFAHTE